MKRRRQRKSNREDVFSLVAIALVLIGFKAKHWLPIPWVISIIPLVLIVATGTWLYLHQRSGTNPKSMNAMDQMTGPQFEEALQRLLKRSGWKLNTTRKTGDFGADLVGTAPWGRSYAIQAKRWKGKVGTGAVQQVIGAKYYYKTDAALVITNNYLTPHARELAHSAGVETWERGRLQKEMGKVGGNNHGA